MASTRSTRHGFGRKAVRLAGIAVAVLVVWELVHLVANSSVIPAPHAVIGNVVSSWSVFASALAVTGREALWGFMVGNALAVTFGAVAMTGRVAGSVVEHLGVLSYCLPIVAVGPILIIVASGHLPEEILAGMAVVFTTMVLTAEGLNSVPAELRDLADVYGASRTKYFLAVRVKFAIPYVFRGLRIAAPAALLGAIIGEFLGSGSGLGVIMVQAEQSLEVARTWAAAGLSTAVAGAAYLLVGAIERVVVPWTREVGL